ncbi:hypothetical protein [Bacillus thuringiensis]|nr:hypothetical protein [Bacillus thuringiensis]
MNLATTVALGCGLIVGITPARYYAIVASEVNVLFVDAHKRD